MKVNVDKDDYYPFYTIDKYWGTVVEIPDDFLKKYNRAMKKFYRVQAKLDKAYKKQVLSK